MTDKDKMLEPVKLKIPSVFEGDFPCITFSAKGNDVCGKLWGKDGVLTFEGNAEASAKVFFEQVICLNNEHLLRAEQAAKESDRKEMEEARQRIEKQKADLDAWDDIIDDFHIAVSCINPKEDMRRAIVALIAEKGALEMKLAEQQAAMQLANIAFTRTADEHRNDYLRGGSVQVSGLRVEAWRAVANCGTEELTKLLAAARQQGFEEGKQRIEELEETNLSLATDNITLKANQRALKQAGRDKLQKELSEQKPVAWAWIRSDGAIWKLSAVKDCEESLGLDHIPLYHHK